MTWRRYLLLPRLISYGLVAPRSQALAWERFWSGVGRVGPDGDVLWDAGEPAEFAQTADRLRRHADLGLPMVDLGCGSGRQARELTGLAPRVVGVDGSAAAIAHAASAGARPGLVFRVADLAEPGLGQRLVEELGPANVHIRGVLHVLDRAGRVAVAANVAALLGARGTVYLCETNPDGDPLANLYAQGARPMGLPDRLRRLVAAGIRAPRHFGPAELAETFPAPAWQVLDSGPTDIWVVPMRPGGPPERLSGFWAALRLASGSGHTA